MRKKRWWAAVVTIGLLVAAGVAAALWAGDDDVASAPDATATTATSTSTTSAPEPTTTTSSTTTTVPVGPVPLAVTAITAVTGAGSGEVELTWSTVADATGYRVLLSDAGGHLLDVMADFSTITGQVTAGADVVNLWSEQHTYVPARDPLAAPDTSDQIRYVDVGAGQRCYRVVAYNDTGDAAPSTVVCASPP